MGAREPVVVGYASALEFWRRSWLKGPRVLEELLGQLFPDDLLAEIAERPGVLGEFPVLHPTASRDAGATDRVAGLLGISRPVDLVVENLESRRQSARVSARSWGCGLSSGLVAQVEDNVYVCAPELAYLQMAAVLHETALVELAYEMCGDYVRLDGSFHMGRHDEASLFLSNPTRLATVCDLYKSRRGSRRARSAASVALPNSWSPAESQLAAVLATSRPRGGFGLEGIVLNSRIYLDGELRHMAGRGYVVPDILLPGDGLCLEYQGALHEGIGTRERDDTKSNVLLMLGIQTIKVWKSQLYDLTSMCAIGDYLEKALGIRRRSASARMLSKRADLLLAFEASSRESLKS